MRTFAAGHLDRISRNPPLKSEPNVEDSVRSDPRTVTRNANALAAGAARGGRHSKRVVDHVLKHVAKSGDDTRPKRGRQASSWRLEPLWRRCERLELIAFDPREPIDPSVLWLNLDQPRHIPMRCRNGRYDDRSTVAADSRAGDDEDIVLVGLLTAYAIAQRREPDVPLLWRSKAQGVLSA